MDPIKIYSSARCPYAQRTRMLMIEKELPFELTEVDLSNKPDWFLKVSPYGKVPVIVDDGETIYESAIINEYLEEKYRNISMMPEELFRHHGNISIFFFKILIDDCRFINGFPIVNNDWHFSIRGYF